LFALESKPLNPVKRRKPLLHVHVSKEQGVKRVNDFVQQDVDNKVRAKDDRRRVE
jgi:hypothetical protein